MARTEGPAGDNVGIGRQAAVDAVTIASGGTTSSWVDARTFAIFGLIVPSGAAGSSVTFKVAKDTGDTFRDLYDVSNVQVALNIAGARAYDLPAELASWPFFEIVSATAETDTMVFTVVKKG